jgi:hypothetical protein
VRNLLAIDIRGDRLLDGNPSSAVRSEDLGYSVNRFRVYLDA